jgi:hypothetical protein
MSPISEGYWARLSALGLIAALGLIVAVALAGRPAPLPPAETFPAGMEAIQAEVTEPPDPTPTPSRFPTTSPGPSPAPSYGRYVFGDDGIFGLPGYPWRGSKATPSPPPLHVFNYRSHAPAGSTRR